MRKTLYLFALAAMASPFSSVYAQDSTAAATPPADAGKLTISGYLDSYYLTAFNRPQSGNLLGYAANSPAAVGYSRAFDRLTNQFAIGLVQTKFAYTNAKSEMVIDLTFGPNAELGNFGNQRFNGAGAGGYATGFSPANSNQQALYGTGAAIKQAYLTYKFTDKWNFTVGQFGTHIGYEVIDAPINYHYSLSNLFNNGPFYHIGLKSQYMFSPKFGLMAGVVNNWDAMTDWKTQKSVIGQVFASPAEGWNLYVNYIGGYNDDGFKVGTPGPTAPGTRVSNTAYAYAGRSYIRQMIDITTGYQITDRFYVGLNAALGWYAFQLNEKEEFKKEGAGTDVDGNGKTNVAYGNRGFGSQLFADSSKYQSWGGIAIYSNFKMNDMFSIGARYEHFDDRNGLRYLNGVNNSLTVTLPITLADGHVIIKPEFRWDTGVLGYAATGAVSNASKGGAVDPNTKDLDGKQYTTGGGLYETPDVNAIKNGAPSNTSVQTPGQSTIGLAFIYKY